jgi:hypothetical protein
MSMMGWKAVQMSRLWMISSTTSRSSRSRSRRRSSAESSASLDQPRDLPLLALQRAVQDEAVAHADGGLLAQVRQGEPGHAGGDVLLHPVGQLAQVQRGEGPALALLAQEEDEAVALPLVQRQQVALAEAVLELDDHGVDLLADGLVGRAAEPALHARQGMQVDERAPSRPCSPQHPRECRRTSR